MYNIQIMKYEDNYLEITQSSNRMNVIYGGGEYGLLIYNQIDNISYICDQRANELKQKSDLPYITIDELSRIDKPIDILICVKNEQHRKQITDIISKMTIDARVFDLFNNIGIPFFQPKNNDLAVYNTHKLETVRIINHDSGWILEKFATKMKEELEKMGIVADIDRYPNPSADMNYYTHFYTPALLRPINSTFMITHVNCLNSIERIKHNLQYSQMGICMSKDTMNLLIANGVPRGQLCYINPAQDGEIKPRKKVIGITHSCHDDIDHRKRATAIIDILEGVNPDYFEIRIMGTGWDKIVEQLESAGFYVVYYPDFEREQYIQLIPTLDYYLYWGFDEGSMGYLDALAAGVDTIVTPQGYHLDTDCNITYPCETIDDFNNTLLSIQEEIIKKVNAVKDWTWENYTKKHVEIWKYILGMDNDYYLNQHKYTDGIFSVFPVKIEN